MTEKEIVDALLKVSEPYEINVANVTVRMTPARRTPEPADDACVLGLDGEYEIVRRPFAQDERDLVCDAAPFTETIMQPGKVYYLDPECDPGSVPGWNRADMGHINSDDGAILRRRFTVPPAWQGKRIILRFEAVYPAARFYLDGELIGSHMSGLTAFECDVTERIRHGQQQWIDVRLLRRHELIRMDMPRHSQEFAGIAQPAYLFCVEEVHIAEVSLDPGLSVESMQAALTANILVRNFTSAKAKARAVLVMTGNGIAQQTSVELELPPGESEHRLVLPESAIEPWSDEQPVLYDVEVRMEPASGAPSRIALRHGFKQFDWRDGLPLLNGKPFKFRGVNYLTFSKQGGMYLTREELRRNLELMKNANINGIRTHFTAPQVLAELCDEMGLYLLQEITIDWVSDWLEQSWCLGPVCHRIEATVRRDRKHACLLGYTLGNENQAATRAGIETFWFNYRVFCDLIKRLHPAAAVLIPPPGPANKIPHMMETRLCDIADMHYSFQDLKQFRQTGCLSEPMSWEGPFEERNADELHARGWSGVWFSSEWGLMNYQPDLLNNPYLSIIDDEPEPLLTGRNTQQVFIDRFEREWGLMRDDEHCLGGAFFPWMCGGSGEPFGWTLFGEDADWGVLTHDLLPKANYWVLRAAYSPVLFPERKVIWKKGDETISFPVRSLYHRIDLAECIVRTMMGPGGRFMGQLRQWRDIPFPLAPHTTGILEVPIWNPVTLKGLESGQPAVCRVAVLEPSGFRPITADIMIVPEEIIRSGNEHIVIGSDASLNEV